MAGAWCEKLSAQDRSFLLFEQRTTHMHLGGVVVFELGPLRNESGGVAIDRLRSYIGSRLHWIPRYRQRLAFRPIDGAPYWVDDERFQLDYHVRHTSLPRPGNEQQLKELAARILSTPLDRSRPLWEAWVVEGLAEDRFAMVLKTHHAVVDGVSGVDLMSTLLLPEPCAHGAPAPRWQARPAPSGWQMWEEELRGRLELPRQLLGELRGAWADPRGFAKRLFEAGATAWRFVGEGLQRPALTPLNRRIGPYRRFDWQVLDLGVAKEIKNRLGGSVNDVVLCTVAGAVRRYLLRHRVAVEATDFRVVVPVSVREPGAGSSSGNRVSAWLLSLPIGERAPRARYRAVAEATARCKKEHLERAVGMFTRVAEVMDPLLTLGVRVASTLAPYNLIVTNVPGPQFPLYLLEARMLAGYPTVPLFEQQGLGVAVLSYDGQLCFGLNADWDVVPDVGDFAADLRNAFSELLRAAQDPGSALATPLRQRRQRRRAL
jgi:WS/DGAT/MGAT family acyltransferase